MKKVSEKELKKTLELHALWAISNPQGMRADLSYRDFRLEDLSQSDLRVADLSHSNLGRSILKGCDLRHANLSGCNLNGSDLEGIKLDNTIGNGKEIKSYNGFYWDICYTVDQLAIGCEQHPISDWWSFSDEEIDEMSIVALEFWKENKDFIRNMIEYSPAFDWRAKLEKK